MHDEEHGVYLFGEEHDEEVMEVEGRCVGLPQGKYVYLVFHGTDKHETYFFKQLIIVSETSESNRGGWRNPGFNGAGAWSDCWVQFRKCKCGRDAMIWAFKVHDDVMEASSGLYREVWHRLITEMKADRQAKKRAQ